MPQGTYLDCALYLSSLDSVRFSWAGRDYLGKAALSSDLAEDLAELEPEAYGRQLYDAVFPPGSELREGLREAIVAAEQEKSRLRFLLHLSPDLPEWVHVLYWELLTDHSRQLALARSPDTAFSRYLGVRRAPGTPTTLRPRLLCVIAAPSNLERFGLAEIRREEVVQRLQAPLGMLADAVDVTVLEPPATLGRLRQRLMSDGGFHLLHFFGHGQNRGGVSALVLEDEQGRPQFVEEELLAEVFLGVRELRLVTLIACHGGAPSSLDPFSGLAGRLVQRGLPAVIAMRRAVSVEDAHLFTNHLYSHIAQTGRADAAVNEARQQLYLANPRGIAWSSPVLYSRLTDGRLWLPQEQEPEGTEKRRFQISPRRLLNPLPWIPALVWLALFILGILPAREAEARLDLWVSRLSFELARTNSLIGRLDLEEVASTRLAAVRLPILPAPAEWSNGRDETQGFLLGALAEDAQLTLNGPPLPAGVKVTLEHQGDKVYRLALDGFDEELSATFQGEVRLKPLLDAPMTLRVDYPKSLELFPRNGSVDLDLIFKRFGQDAFPREIPVDRLGLWQIVERHTPKGTELAQQSTLLEGKAHLRATGRDHSLKKGDGLRFSAVSGEITDLRLGDDGIRFGFRGRVAGLERTAGGLEPESLMPSMLDLWLAGPVQVAVNGASGATAALVLILTILGIRPPSRLLKLLGAATAVTAKLAPADKT